MKVKTALITGISGQDGSALAKMLSDKWYQVVGIVRRTSTHPSELKRLEGILDKITLYDGDMLDQTSLQKIIERVKPDEIYNLAAQSFVGTSWDQPFMTMDVNAVGLMRILESLRNLNMHKEVKVYQASSSEMFGNQPAPQNEETPFQPESPYAISKATAHHIAQCYNKSYGMFVACGILFNHESSFRGEEFVTKKIAKQVVEIKFGDRQYLELGNVHAKRDWGYSPEYMEAAWMMLQQGRPGVYVIATNETHTIDEFIKEAFDIAEVPEEKRKVMVKDNLIRPNDVNCLRGDYSKAKKDFGWEPRVKFKELVKIMVQYEIDSYKKKGS